MHLLQFSPVFLFAFVEKKKMIEAEATGLLFRRNNLVQVVLNKQKISICK